MNAQDIERYLELLGQALAEQGITRPIRVLLLGGAYMLTQLKVRRTTNDIDVLALDEEWEDETVGIPLPIALWEAIHSVASRLDVDPKWFNTIIADFIHDAGEVPRMTLWHSFGPLDVYLPPDEYILVLKLLAHRPKDRQDTRALFRKLKIRTREQAQQLIDSYIPNKTVQHLYSIDLTLDRHFPSQ